MRRRTPMHRRYAHLTHRWVLVDPDGQVRERVSYPTELHAQRFASEGQTPQRRRVTSSGGPWGDQLEDEKGSP